MCFADKNADIDQNVYVVTNCKNTAIVEFSDSINGVEVVAMEVINSLYLANIIKYGNDEIDRFGGNLRVIPDWYKISIKGIGLKNECTGIIDFFLADYRFDNNEEDYLIEKWKYIDLRELSKVKRLEISLSSSYDNEYGEMIKYFCLDNLRIRRF
jgi:hypothetical protein